MTTSPSHRALAAVVDDFVGEVEHAEQALRIARRAARRDDCHEAMSAFLTGAQRIGAAEGIGRFLPQPVLDRAAQRVGLENVLANFRETHHKLERCIRPPALKKIRGFVRTTGQMRSRGRRAWRSSRGSHG